MRKALVFLVALALGAGSAVYPGDPIAGFVAAHCTTTSGNFYAYENEFLSVGANAVMGNIDWTQGNVCTSGVSHSVTICQTDTCGRWVQVGWRYYSFYVEPMMYCEFGGNTYKIVEFSISHATHHYKMQKNGTSQSQSWGCYRDQVSVYSYSLANAGFASGSYFVAQGEAHQFHVQVGLMAPNRLSFFNMQRRTTSDSSWHFVQAVPGPPDSPYGSDRPVAGNFRVWTNAH